MKIFFILIVLIAAFFAFYTPNVSSNFAIYIKVAAIAIVMVGVMKLMQKVPSRNQEKEEDEI